jgi:hypothetical protein
MFMLGLSPSLSVIMLNKRVNIGCGRGLEEFLGAPDLMNVALF